MKRILWCGIFIGVLYFGSRAQSMDCAKFKTGKFILKDAASGNTNITRNKKFQFETGARSKGTIKLEVHWLDNCTYTLRKIKGPKDPNGGLPKDAVLTVHIMSVSGNTYHAKVKSNFSAVEYEFDITKLK